MQWRDITAVGPTKKHKLSLGHYLFISVIDNILKYFSLQGLREALLPQVTRGNRRNQAPHYCLQNTHPFGHTLLRIWKAYGCALWELLTWERGEVTRHKLSRQTKLTCMSLTFIPPLVDLFNFYQRKLGFAALCQLMISVLHC